VTRGVRRLPLPRAPHTLLPRVMTAVQQWAQRPWYAREWFTWPLGWQIASVAALLALLVGGVTQYTSLQTAVMAALAAGSASLPGAPGFLQGAQFVPEMLAAARGLAQGAVLIVQTAGVVARAAFDAIGPYVAAVVLMMCLACAALGLALTYVVNVMGPQAQRSA
jgi:hypothetical protein